MIETLWKRHYHPGVTGSYHGDMAHAFAAMLEDTDCCEGARRKMLVAIRVHIHLESLPDWHSVVGGRKWFTERFGGK